MGLLLHDSLYAMYIHVYVICVCVHVCMSVFGLVSHIYKEDLKVSHIYTITL